MGADEPLLSDVVPHFEDYHRTIIGYHGTRRSVALQIVQGLRSFTPSRNKDDWLGHGIYFWEHAPQQAWWWGECRRKRQKWNEDVAVLGSMIRLGACFDLLDPKNADALQAYYRSYADLEKKAGKLILRNYNTKKYLDCAVFQYAYAVLEANNQRIDSCRAVYVPTGKEKRIWPRSWITPNAHIQICVRNPRCILGTWLVQPSEEEEGDEESNEATVDDGQDPQSAGNA